MHASDVPDDRWFYAVVFMPQNIPDARDLGPGHLWVGGLGVVRKPAARFRNNFEATFYGALQRPALGKGLKVGAGQGLLDPTDRIGHVRQPDPGALHASKTPGRRTIR
jgi:hypothetical protein